MAEAMLEELAVLPVWVFKFSWTTSRDVLILVRDSPRVVTWAATWVFSLLDELQEVTLDPETSRASVEIFVDEGFCPTTLLIWLFFLMISAHDAAEALVYRRLLLARLEVLLMVLVMAFELSVRALTC